MRSTAALLLALVVAAERAAPQSAAGNRQTQPPPARVTITAADMAGYGRVHTGDTLEVWYKEERDIFRIVDRRNGYTWSTGIDAGFRQEDRMNRTYASYANSFVTLEYFENGVLNKLSSTMVEEEGSRDFSVLRRTGDGAFVLSVDTQEYGFALEVGIRFQGNAMFVSIDRSTVVERSMDRRLATIYIAPFLGAVGGRVAVYDAVGDLLERREKMPDLDGYVFVPDGPGALIRFRPRAVSLSPFERKVYGPDPATAYYDLEERFGYAEPPPVCLPVYGVAHGREQAAFVAFATEGDEHMTVYASPYGTTTWYTYVANKFVYRKLYFRVLNQQREGIESVPETADTFSIGMTWVFLAGADADWAGMARAYRADLRTRGFLRPRSGGATLSMPLRLDVLMADVSRGLFGYVPVVATAPADLVPMARSIRDLGVMRASFGLYGWRRGGRHAQSMDRLRFPAAELRDAQTGLEELGYTLSLAQDYATFTDAMASPNRGAASHLNRQFTRVEVFPERPVFETVYRASTRTMAAWLETHAAELARLGFRAITADGAASSLPSDYPAGRSTGLAEGAARLTEAFARARASLGSVETRVANQYVLPYLDRVTGAPLEDSRYQIETDTVPFLQMVLSGSVETYAPYVNLTHPSDGDVLKMIDFGTYPAFMLTWKDSHVLEDTNSNDLYSTGFAGQRERIRAVYARMSGALGPVTGAVMVDRVVPWPGVAAVTYDNGVTIVVNYGDLPFAGEGYEVAPRDYAVVRGSP